MPKDTAIPLVLIEETIRNRAYELFEQRGYEHGHDLDDWLQAKADILGTKRVGRADQSATLHKMEAA